MSAITTEVIKTAEEFLILPAGSYTFDFQLSVVQIGNGTGPYMRLTNILICVLNFSDKMALSYDSGWVSCPATTLTTLINQNFTPVARKLAVGTVKKYTLFLVIYCTRLDQRVNKVKNPGESNDSNFFNWRIFLDDVEKGWIDRNDDCGAVTVNPTYAEGAYGSFRAVLDAGSSINLKIKCYNGFGAAYDGIALVKAILCPWIIPSIEYEPLTLDFPQGSTFYITTEPLKADPTKNVKIGKKRFMSFGDSTDYYSTASGTGILNHNYTFEIVEVANSVLLVSGYGGCISIIGCDIR
ncbi:MAG: hypothetical protein H3Z54_08280 [archaeon]|nr:hypothetical protein [archaeon]MCP8316899.1 hypothetical protein [archaeon]